MTLNKRLARLSAASILALAGLGASGCDQRDPIAAELERADWVISALTTAGNSALPTHVRSKEDLQWVIDRLSGKGATRLPRSVQGIAGTDGGELPTLSVAPIDSDNPSQAAAALLLVARAQAGLAETNALDQAEKEAGLLNQVAVIRSSVDEWLALNALASGTESYDPSADLARLESQAAGKRAELVVRQEARTRQDAMVEQLRGRAAEATARADAERTKEVEVRARMTGISQTARATLLDEATRYRRAADAADKEASGFLAEAAKEEPKAQTIAREAELVQQQIDLLATGMAQVRARTERGRLSATEARARAADAAGRVDAAITTATTLRGNADAPANEAVRLYGQAAASAKKAVTQLQDSQSKTQASAVSAAIAQGTGDVHAARARAMAQFASVLASAANAEPALPNASVYRQKADDAAAIATKARDDARAAYESAMNLFRASGAGGGGAGATGGAGVKDRADAVSAKLEAMSKSFDDTIKATEPDGSSDAAPGDSPTDGQAAPSAPAGDFDASAVDGEVRAFIQTQIDAARGGEAGNLANVLAFEDEKEAALAADLLGPAMTIGGFGKAVEAAYGKSLATLISETRVESVKSSPALGMVAPMFEMLKDPTAMGGADLGQLANVKPEDLTITASGPDRATVAIKDQPTTMTVVKKADGWKLLVPRTGMADGPAGAQIKMMAPLLKGAAAAITKVTQGIGAGTYTDADAMLTDLNLQLIAAMAKAGGPGAGTAPEPTRPPEGTAPDGPG